MLVPVPFSRAWRAVKNDSKISAVPSITFSRVRRWLRTYCIEICAVHIRSTWNVCDFTDILQYTTAVGSLLFVTVIHSQYSIYIYFLTFNNKKQLRVKAVQQLHSPDTSYCCSTTAYRNTHGRDFVRRTRRLLLVSLPLWTMQAKKIEMLFVNKMWIEASSGLRIRT